VCLREIFGQNSSSFGIRQDLEEEEARIAPELLHLIIKMFSYIEKEGVFLNSL
jgi:hypothetical protein